MKTKPMEKKKDEESYKILKNKITQIQNVSNTTSGKDFWVGDKVTWPDSTIWLPQQPYPTIQQGHQTNGSWTLTDIGNPVQARCYSRSCKNETNVLTELKLGKYLNITTYICETCLKDLSDKVKEELGLEIETK